MPALEFILPPAATALTGAGEPPASPAGPAPGGEPFDQLMNRALAPSETGASPDPDRPTGTLTALTGGKPPSVPAAPTRRRSQNGNPFAKTATAIASPAVSIASDKTSNPSTTSASSPAVPVHKNEAPANPDAPAILPGIIVQLMAAVPPGPVPVAIPAAKIKNAPAAKGTTDCPPAAVTIKSAGMTLPSAGALTGEAKTASLPPATTGQPEAVSNLGAKQLIGGLRPAEMATATGTPDAATRDFGPAKSDSSSRVPDSSAETGQKLSPPSTGSSTVTPAVPETAVHLAQNEISTPAGSSGEFATPTSNDTHGTPAAKLYLSMNKTEKTNKVAGSTEKVLPVDADSTALGKMLPVDQSVRSGSRGGSSTVVIGISGPEPANPVVPSAGGVSASTAPGLQPRDLDRTHDIISMHAMRLMDSRSDSLQVVIKPGGGMQLSLELRQHGDAIDARVVLQRGEFSPLNQHWPELQQRLEQRGVRLAPLAGGDNAATTGGNGFQQQPQREPADSDPLAASAFAEFALAQPAFHLPPPAATPAGGRGWETWA